MFVLLLVLRILKRDLYELLVKMHKGCALFLLFRDLASCEEFPRQACGTPLLVWRSSRRQSDCRLLVLFFEMLLSEDGAFS